MNNLEWLINICKHPLRVDHQIEINWEFIISKTQSGVASCDCKFNIPAATNL